MNSPWPSSRLRKVTPLKVAPVEKSASPAPVTLAASSCAATGVGPMTPATAISAVNTNPSRVIVSPSNRALLVDLDVSTGERASLGHQVVCDGELVHAVARLAVVLDVRHKAARRAVRAAGT